MVTLENIQFSYAKGFPALSGISARIEPGIHLLAGENGAGKTTLLRIMSGTVAPQKGKCSINDADPISDLPSQKGNVFLVEENMDFPGKTILEFASLHSPFYPNFSPDMFAENLKAFGLSGHEPMKSLSLGNRKKSQIAYALSLGVDLLLLDEPTNGLDIQSKAVLRSVIARSVEEGQTVIIATHTVSDLENLYDGAIMISGSHILFASLEEDVVSKLAFTVTNTRNPDALYSESALGRFLNITHADQMETRADWRLLYCALNSPKRDDILNILNSDPANHE